MQVLRETRSKSARLCLLYEAPNVMSQNRIEIKLSYIFVCISSTNGKLITVFLLYIICTYIIMYFS